MRKELEYYKQEPVKKMGVWSLAPADSETWHTEKTSEYFVEIFGFTKGTLTIHNFEDDSQHCYFPAYVFENLYKYIEDTNKEDYKKLENILKGFYEFKVIAKEKIPNINPSDLSKLSAEELVDIYQTNRDLIHKATVYDQFGWIGEDYWPPIMEDILVNKYNIKKDSPEYFDALFKLAKPEEISTTLEEKRAVLAETIKIKEDKQEIKMASQELAKAYGWMPVFTYGTPWDAKYYEGQLEDAIQKDLIELKSEYDLLEDYSNIRNKELQEIVEKYNINEKDLQIFVDFGLALDARNEAEYIVSLGGFHLLAIYKEISKRTYLAINQIRKFTEDEIIQLIKGEVDGMELLKTRPKLFGWGFNREMTERFIFSNEEAEEIFDHLNKHAENLQGNIEGKGLCANTGKAKGPARIIFSPEENDRVKQGDILITPATTVDYLPAMKRAIAFVTEVGGLTCHAAVVAREFGVPSVVSYKDATTKFKDGDIIELDADKGIVKKL